MLVTRQGISSTIIYRKEENNCMKHLIKDVLPGSIAEEMGIEAGDKLISINDNIIEDVLDYHFYV